jgi:3,5-epimerase/4-reductase
MFLIYGGNGWIGQKIIKIIETMQVSFLVSKIRADDINAVESEIKQIKPTNILCLLGRTHGIFEGQYIPTIDYLEKKGKINENVRDNLFCPISLAILCKKYEIHLTYLGTGCIFTYNDDKKIFTEDDEPNFFGSSYSVVKGYTDRLMHMFDNVLNVRIRMPISSDTSPRNFIMKLIKYEKICSIQNSMTVLDELLPIMCNMSLNKETGTINLTNPGTIEHSEILDMYKELVDPGFTYNLFSYQDQMAVIACDRSNNELDASLLSSKYKVKNITDSLRDIMIKIKNRRKIISYSSKGYYIGKGNIKNFNYNFCESNNLSQMISIEREKDETDWICYIDPTRIFKKSISSLFDFRYAIVCFCRANNTVDNKFLLVNLKHPVTKKFFECLDSVGNLSKLLSIQNNTEYVKFIHNPENYFSNDQKILWREFCCDNLEYLKLYNLPNNFSEKINCVLVEFRKLDNVEFVVRNCINKLREKCTYTIVCGNDNYDYMVNISNKLDNKVQIIKIDITDPTVNDYNNLLLSLNFWQLLKGEYILIYQEDTCIFKDNIEDFLGFDYIGAPWPESQKENINSVGNGGFSLRRRKAMIEVLTRNISIESLKISENCKKYMKNSKLQNTPEDIYFTNALINHNIGTVADFETARKFSQELVFSDDPFAGHNWWLHEERINSKHIFEYDFSRIFNCVAISSPYQFTLGGGEKYLSHIMKYFISIGYIICLFTISDFNTVKNTLKLYLTQEELKYVKLQDHNLLFFENIYNKVKYDYFIQMNNSSIPYTKGMGKFNIYHCQFPNEAGRDITLLDYDIDTILSYDVVIVNSEYTRDNLSTIYKDLKIPLEVIYPPCIDIISEKKFDKLENTFVMVGRIFERDEMANNKYFDLAIKAFNKIDGKLFIIGSVKCFRYYKKLLKMIEKPENIHILTDIDDDIKISILKKSKYYIQLTGILDHYPCNKEHFGISLVEAINYGCIPICFNGGYSKYIINEDNGYLINNYQDLVETIENINKSTLNKKSICIDDFTFIKFKEKLSKYKCLGNNTQSFI